MAFPHAPRSVPGILKDTLSAAGHRVVHDVVPAVGHGLANVATLGEYQHPGGLRAYGSAQKQGMDLSDPRAMALMALMLAGRGRVEGPQRFSSLSDPYDQAAKNMAFQRDRDALIKQMQGVVGTQPFSRIPGAAGRMTTMQKAYLKQLKFDPNNLAGEPGFNFLRPRQVEADPSTHGLTSALGYSVGDPMVELLATMGIGHRTSQEVEARLGQNTREGSKMPGGLVPRTPGLAGGSGVEDWFPLFQRGSPTFRFGLKNNQGQPILEAEPFTTFLGNLIRGYGRDTGPPTR